MYVPLIRMTGLRSGCNLPWNSTASVFSGATVSPSTSKRLKIFNDSFVSARASQINSLTSSYNQGIVRVPNHPTPGHANVLEYAVIREVPQKRAQDGTLGDPTSHRSNTHTFYRWKLYCPIIGVTVYNAT